jgi:hypothetical protein
MRIFLYLSIIIFSFSQESLLAEDKNDCKLFSHLQRVRVPSSEENPTRATLQLLNLYIDALQQQNFEKMTENPQFPDIEVNAQYGMKIWGKIGIVNDKVVYVNFYRYGIKKTINNTTEMNNTVDMNRGFRIYFNQEGMPILYLEGVFKGLQDIIKIENSLYQEGIEIWFHSNGQPSRYSKISPKEQIKKLEWDQDGNITDGKKNEINQQRIKERQENENKKK